MTTPTMPSSSGRSPTRFTARTPEDLLAAVPVVLGFQPEDSIVMLTFGAPSTFHARIDLPQDHHDPEQVDAAVGALLEPSLRHRVPRVVLVLYADAPERARVVWRRLVTCFTGAGVEVIDGLHADGRRWYSLTGRSGVPAEGVAYDLSAHPFRVQSIFDGAVTHASRQELAGSLAGDVERVRAVEAALSTADPCHPVGAALLVAAHLSGDAMSDADLACLLLGLREGAVRDSVLWSVTRATAGDHVRWWTDVVRRSPTPLLSAPAALLGFTAWLAGHGALAWCALDRCLDADPDCVLGLYVAQALTHALPPSAWEP